MVAEKFANCQRSLVYFVVVFVRFAFKVRTPNNVEKSCLMFREHFQNACRTEQQQWRRCRSFRPCAHRVHDVSGKFSSSSPTDRVVKPQLINTSSLYTILCTFISRRRYGNKTNQQTNKNNRTHLNKVNGRFLGRKRPAPWGGGGAVGATRETIKIMSVGRLTD